MIYSRTCTFTSQVIILAWYNIPNLFQFLKPIYSIIQMFYRWFYQMFPMDDWSNRSCSNFDGFDENLFNTAEEEFLHQFVTRPTRFRRENRPSVFGLVTAKFCDTISAISLLILLGMWSYSDHALLSFHFFYMIHTNPRAQGLSVVSIAERKA